MKGIIYFPELSQEFEISNILIQKITDQDYEIYFNAYFLPEIISDYEYYEYSYFTKISKNEYKGKLYVYLHDGKIKEFTVFIEFI